MKGRFVFSVKKDIEYKDISSASELPITDTAIQP